MALFHAQRFSKLWYLTPLTIIVDANWIISMKWTSQKTTSLKRNSNIDSLFSLCFIYRLLLNERKNGMQRKREGGTAISIKIGHFFVCVRNLWTLAVLLCLHWIKFRNILKNGLNKVVVFIVIIFSDLSLNLHNIIYL